MKIKDKSSRADKLLNIIIKKCHGRDYDISSYIESMDKIMKDVYHLMGRGVEGSIDKESFMNLCWTKLEEDLILKICDLSFKNDAHLIQYIRKTFENILLEKISALTPGYLSRKKQIERILKKRCVDSCKKMCRCWKLLKYSHKSVAPANISEIMEAGNKIVFPEFNPSSPKSSKSPSIKDKDMEEFLVRLIESAGGMVKCSDLTKYVLNRLNILPIQIKHMESSLNDVIEATQTDEIISPSHEMIAEEIISGMDNKMILFHYLRFVKEMTLEQISKNMKMSIGTIHNLQKSHEEYMKNCFNEKDETFPHEEIKLLIRLILNKIAKIMEKK